MKLNVFTWNQLMVTTQYFFRSHLRTKNETLLDKFEGYYIIIKYHRIIIKFTTGLNRVSDVDHTFEW